MLKYPLYLHQQEAVDKLTNTDFFLIGDECGVGKTLEMIASIDKLYNDKKITSVLLICPCSIKYQWQSEIKKFSDLSCIVIDGNKKERENQWTTLTLIKIVNYELILKDEKFTMKGFDCVVLDEAQKIKSISSKIGKKIKVIPRKYRYAMTGTPIMNSPLDVYSIMQFLHPLYLENYWHFRNNYIITKKETMFIWKNGKRQQISFDKIVGYQKLNELAEKLKPVMIRRLKKDVLKSLPEKIEKDYLITLTDEQKLKYNTLRMQMKEKIIKGESVLGEIIHLRFICSGINENLPIATHKLTEVLNIIEANSFEKIVIFTNWTTILARIKNEIETKTQYKCSYISGELNAKEKQQAKEDFISGKTHILICTEAGESGLNLQHASSILINYDSTWSHAKQEQRMGRIHRDGQNNTVLIYNFICKDTIEERVNQLIQQKKYLSEVILDKDKEMLKQVI